MLVFIILLIFLGIPATILILGVRWVLRKEKKKEKAKSFTKYAFTALFVIIVGLCIADWMNRRHVWEFELNDIYAIELIGIEQHGLKDNPVAFYIKIQDSKSEKTVEFEFKGQEDPSYQFYLDPETVDIIIMRGMDSNIGANYTINMSDSSIDLEYGYETEMFKNLTLCAEISSAYELSIK